MSARTVSINMDGTLGDYGNEPDQAGLDMNDMVADFDGTGVLNFGQPEETKDGQTGELLFVVCRSYPERQRPDLNSTDATPDPELQRASGGPTPTSSHMPLASSSQAPPTNIDDMFKTETGLDGPSDDEDEDSPAPQPKRRRETQDVPGGFTLADKDGETGRRKIRIEYITDKSRRHITFSKRKSGIMKKVSFSSSL